MIKLIVCPVIAPLILGALILDLLDPIKDEPLRHQDTSRWDDFMAAHMAKVEAQRAAGVIA